MMDHGSNIKTNILGVGDAMVDLTTRASHLPPRGGNIWSTAVTLSPGGTTANVSANIAKLGLRATFVGCVGDDPYGRYVVDEFHNIGVDTTHVQQYPGTFTGIVLAIIDDSGERTFIACARGAAHTRLNVRQYLDARSEQTQILHTSGVCLVEEPSRTNLLSILRHTYRSGMEVYFDPNLRLEGDEFPNALFEAQWEAFSFANVILIGENEVELMCPGKSMAEAAAQILRQCNGIVVVKQGERGATLFSMQGEIHCPAFPVAVKNTAGAGDSFDAGFIAARVRGASLHHALVYACAVAGLKVTKSGSWSVPTHEEALSYLASQGLTMDFA